MSGRCGRLLPGLATAAVALATTAGRAAAQCSMCGAATPYAGSSPERTAASFAVGALVLLVPVLGMLATLVTYVWRNRH